MTNIQRLMISAGLASAPFLSSCGDAFPGVVRSRLPAVDAEVSMLAPAAANEPRMFMLDCDPAASDAALGEAGAYAAASNWWHVVWVADPASGDETRDLARLVAAYEAGVKAGLSPRVFRTVAKTEAGRALESRFLARPMRPEPAARAFRSASVDAKVEAVASALRAKGRDKLALMFENCFPNTLDTTVRYRRTADGDDDTFVITGDIPAMWLRDSAAQVWPYLPVMKDDEPLRRMIRGVIRRQFACILLDPYANAFNDLPPEEAAEPGEMKDGVRVKRGVFERKYELDSLCYPVRLAYGYWTACGDASVFDGRWLAAVRAILGVMREQQHKRSWDSSYFFARKAVSNNAIENRGRGRQVKPVGLIASSFRPSDDATQLPFLVPSNLMAVDILRKAARILEEVNHDSALASECRALADEVDAALAKHAVREHPTAGRVWAFEVDGYGSALFMDDANVPSLVAVPYFTDVPADDPVYRATRAYVWSEQNPWFFRGRAGEGIGGPHCGYGSIWPMSVILKGLTTDDPAEALACLDQLVRTDARTAFIHESHDLDDAESYTRPWFAWANTLFGELVLRAFDRGWL